MCYKCLYFCCYFKYVILPKLLTLKLTDEEKKPSGCPSKMSIKQIMHLLYHFQKSTCKYFFSISCFCFASITLGPNFKIIQ